MKFLNILLITLSFTMQAKADTFNDYSEPVFVGVETELLVSEERRQEVLQYFRNTRKDIVRILREARGKSTQERLNVYSDGIIKLLVESTGRPKYVMKIALSQGYQLVNGVPDMSGGILTDTILSPATLDNSLNDQLKADILKYSLVTAYEHASSSVEAIRNQSLARLRYEDLAIQKIVDTERWWTSVFDVTSSLKFIKQSSIHIYSILNNDDRLAAAVGEELLGDEGIYGIVKKVEEIENSRVLSDTGVFSSIRTIRRYAKNLFPSLKHKLAQYRAINDR
ncbi:MAG: hypothetical protein CL677_03060 [Bdellovibrionaceae bacterium]|nr:hypothetical protein [Pseudobdellovibrionaceae bacterium]|tara:strand:+ start:104351 stop:105193 length:843 start_codon:yes stop_codon:yes gene_type:complete